MYPAGELSELEKRKAIVRSRIAARRDQCAEAATHLSQPIALIDRGLALWRSVPPVARAIAVPIALLLARKLSQRTGFVGKVARMVPIVLNVVRGFAGRSA